jgi:hypothetical protein
MKDFIHEKSYDKFTAVLSGDNKTFDEIVQVKRCWAVASNPPRSGMDISMGGYNCAQYAGVYGRAFTVLDCPINPLLLARTIHNNHQLGIRAFRYPFGIYLGDEGKIIRCRCARCISE